MTYPIFVLEGPDNSGKSTLAKELARITGGKILHATYRFKGRMRLYHLAQFRLALREAQNQTVIMDRWWPSEVAYGNTYRDGCEYAEDLPWFQDIAKQYYVSYTYCLPTRWEEYWDFCKRVWKDDEEMYAKDEAAYHWLWMNYRELALNHYRYYPTNLVQHYNVTLEGNQTPRFSNFARYIKARMLNQLRILNKEEKGMMKSMSQNWKQVGRNELWKTPVSSEVQQDPVILEDTSSPVTPRQLGLEL